jgi:hypothetical protein
MIGNEAAQVVDNEVVGTMEVAPIVAMTKQTIGP